MQGDAIVPPPPPNHPLNTTLPMSYCKLYAITKLKRKCNVFISEASRPEKRDVYNAYTPITISVTPYNSRGNRTRLPLVYRTR